MKLIIYLGYLFTQTKSYKKMKRIKNAMTLFANCSIVGHHGFLREQGQ